MVSYAHTRKRVVIVSASIGAGHDGAAAELARRITAAGFAVDRFDFVDLLPPPIGPIMRASYKALLKVVPSAWDGILGRLNHTSRLSTGAVGFAALASRRLRRAIGTGTAVVVSTYPLASQALGWLREHDRLDAPVVTFLTDMSVHPLWVHPDVDLHLALHDIAARQADDLGAKAVQVIAPAVRPVFRPVASPASRDRIRARFALPDGPLALVVSGSWGVGEIDEATRDIAATGLATPVVACGHNAALRTRIAKSGTGVPLGWITDMPDLISVCDVVVQNAGGLTSLEALATGVPVITYRCLVGHGRTNADALDRAGWVPWAREPSELPDVLRRALAGHRDGGPRPGTDPAEAILALAGHRGAVTSAPGTAATSAPSTGVAA